MEVGWDGKIVNVKAKEMEKRKKIFSFDISLWISLWIPSVPLFYEKILHGERYISFVYLKRLFLPMKFDFCKSYYSKIKLYLKNILDMMYFNRSH